MIYFELDTGIDDHGARRTRKSPQLNRTCNPMSTLANSVLGTTSAHIAFACVRNAKYARKVVVGGVFVVISKCFSKSIVW